MPVALYSEKDMFLRIFGEKLRELEGIEWPIPSNPMVCAWIHLSESDPRIMLYIDVANVRHVEEECDIPLAAIMSFEISSIKVAKR
jgi:hypothetical protein